MNYVKYFSLCLKNLPVRLFSLLFVLNLQNVMAQSTDRINLDYQQFGDTNGVSTNSVSGLFGHRMFLDDDGANLLTLSLKYSQVQLTDDTLSGPDKERQLKSISTEMNLLRILNEEYSVAITLRPGVFGDLEGSLSDDFRLEGGFVVTRFMSDNLTLGLGLGRGTNFGRDLVVPLFQFLYFASDKIVVRGLLPVSASLWYIPSQQWEFGFIYRLQGSLYNIDETNISGAKQVGFAAAQTGVASRYKVFGNNVLEAEAGVTALRRYEWTDKRGTSFDISQKPFLDRDLGNTGYFKLSWLQKF